MLIEHDREKLLNAATYFVKKTKYCGKTKLLKLLYFVDFMHFRETGKSVTGLEYYAWDFGPVPTELYEEMDNPGPDLKEALSFLPIKDKSFVEIKAKKRFDDRYFTKRELRILERVAFIFKEARAEDMVEASHLPNHPWEKTIKTKGRMVKIDYLLALDNTPESLSEEEARERISDREEIRRAFVR